MKCPICKEEIQDDAIKCKHCGEVLNKSAYANTSVSPTKPPVEKQIPVGKWMHWLRRKVAVPLAVLIVLCVVFNAIRLRSGLRCLCYDEQCHQFALGPLRFHLHMYSANCGFGEYKYTQYTSSDGTHWGAFERGNPWIIFRSPIIGVGFSSTRGERFEKFPECEDRMVALPLLGIVLFTAFVIYWMRLWKRQPEKAQAILNYIPEVRSDTILTLRFNFANLGLGEKFILGAASIALLSLFLPWAAMLGFSSSGWGAEGYMFLLLFLYPVIGVFNVNGLNKTAGIICGVLALVCTIAFIADKHFEIDGVSGNASASGVYLFATATIGLIVGAVKYVRKSRSNVSAG